MIAINNNIGKLKRDAVVYGISDGIEQYFDKDLYFPQLEINSREEAIEFLCEKVVKKKVMRQKNCLRILWNGKK